MRAMTWTANLSPEKIQGNQQRLEYTFSQYFKAIEDVEQHDILVCHGNILRYLICRVLQVAPEAWINADIHNCGISEVLIETSGKMMLISHNPRSAPPSLSAATQPVPKKIRRAVPRNSAMHCPLSVGTMGVLMRGASFVCFCFIPSTALVRNCSETKT